jgi:autotransporter-associated beta strand protein
MRLPNNSVFGRRSVLVIAAMMFVVMVHQSRATSQIWSTDSGADATYNSGWTDGLDGGSGFDAWVLKKNTTNNGFYVAGAAGGNNPGQINGRSWGMFANGGSNSQATAYRGFNLTDTVTTPTQDLFIGSSFKFDLNYGTLSGGFIEVALRNGNTTTDQTKDLTGSRVAFRFTAGDPNWKVTTDGGANFVDTGITYAQGKNATWTLTLNSANTYSVTTSNGGSWLNKSLGGTNDSTINSLALSTFQQTGQDFIVNNIKISGDAAIWKGGGANSNSSTAGNWLQSSGPTSGSYVVFAQLPATSPTIDTAYTVSGISFDSGQTTAFTVGASGAGGFTINTGANNSVGIVNNSTAAETINVPIALSNSQTWNAERGNITIGGTVNLGANTLTIAGFDDLAGGSTTHNVTLGAAISGAGGIVKTEGGTLALNASNGFTGGLTINAGTVQLGNVGALNSTTPNAVTFGASSTGKLQLNGNSVTVGSLNTNATVGTPIIESGSATAGTDTLTVNDTTSDTYAGVLQNGSTRVLALTKSGSGTLTLKGLNTYTGGTNINGGILNLGVAQGASSGPLGGTAAPPSTTIGTISFGGGTLQYSAANQTDYSSRFSAALGQAYRIDTNGQTVGWASAKSPTSGTLTKLGLGTLNITTGANGWTGATTIDGGTLNANTLAAGNSNSSIGAGANTAGFLIFGGGTLQHDAANVATTDRLFTIGDTAGDTATLDSSAASTTNIVNFTNAGSIAFGNTNAHTLTLTGTNTGANALAAAIGDNTGATSVTKTGAGSWALSGASSYSGPTTITTGTLSTLGSNSSAGTTSNSGTLILGTGANGGLASGALTLNTSAIKSSDANSRTLTNALTLNGVVAAGAASTGDLTFNGNATLTGASTINAGSNVTLGGSAALGANRLTVTGGSNTTVNGAVGATGAGDVLKQGAGTLTFGAGNTYAGGTFIDQGIVSYTAAGVNSYTGNIQLGSTNGTVNAATLTLGATGGGQTLNSAITVTSDNSGVRTIKTLNSDGGATGDVFGGAITDKGGFTLDAGSGGVTFSGAISDVGGITIGGTGGTVLFSGGSANTYSGLTTVNVGELDLSKSLGNAIGGNLTIGDGTSTDTVKLLLSSDQISDNAAVLIDKTSGILNLNNFTETVGSIADRGAGTGSQIQLGSGQLNTGDSSNTTFSGVISGTGGKLAKLGTGTFILAGANSYTGSTFGLNGTLQFNVAQDPGFTGTLTLGNTSGINSATFAIGTGAVTLSNPITIRSGSSGTKTLAANNTSGVATFSGNVTMNDDLTATANSGGTLAFTGSTFTLNGNRLAVTGANNTSIGNVISGTGDILKQGAGALTLTGNNTFGPNSGGTSSVFMDQGIISLATGGTLGTTNGTTTGLINMGADGTGGLNTELKIADSGITLANPVLVRYLATGGKTFSGSFATGSSTFSGAVSLADHLTITAANGGTLLLTGVISQAAGTLSTTPGAGLVNSNAPTGGFNTGGTKGPGVIINSGTSSTGIVEYDTAMTYTGDTVVNSGTLQFDGSGSLANSTIRLGHLGAATLNLISPTGSTLNVTVNVRPSTGTKTISASNTSGTSTLGGHFALDDNATVQEASATGTLAITQAHTDGATANTGTDIKGFTLTLTPTGIIDISGDIYSSSGTGTVTLSGTGILKLSGANTYTGGTNINGGILNVGSSGALGTTGGIKFGSGGVGGTLQYSAANQTDYSGRFSGAAGQTFNIDTNGQNVPFTTALASTSGTLTKIGAGTLTLSGASSYTGLTTINGGTLKLSNATGITTPRLANTSGIVVNTGGTLLLAQGGTTVSTDRINNSATVKLDGGKFDTGGFSEGAHSVVGIGALTLQSSSTIDMGSGASILNFGGTSTRIAGILTIDNWSGDKDLGNGTDQILVANALPQAFLDNINFTGFSSGAMELPSGELVPVPEPSTWVAAGLSVFALGYTQRKRFAKNPRS